MTRYSALFTAVLLTASAAAAETPEKSKTEKDTTVLSDSAKAAVESRRKELLGTLREANRYLIEPVKSADSVFNPYELNRRSFSRDDNTSWTDVLRGQGEYVPVFYSPTYYFNRPLWRGYTVPLTAESNSLLTGAASADQISFGFEPIQLEKLTINADGSFIPLLFPRTWVSPQVCFTMENGLFDGNSLEARAMRNFSKNFSVGLFSSYRELKRDDYTHDNGGVASFYRGMKSVDTANIAVRGRNPQSQSHISSLSLIWEKKSRIALNGRYENLSNDIIFPHPHDSMKTVSALDSVWFNREGYNSELSASIQIPAGEKVRLDLEGKAGELVHRENPLSLQLIRKDRDQRGEQAFYGAGTSLKIAPASVDTISLTAAYNRSVTEHTNSALTGITESRVTLKNSFKSENIPLILDASAGSAILFSSDSTEFYPAVSASARITPGIFAFEGWGKLDIVPLAVSFDSLLIPVPGDVGDNFWGTGIRASAAGKKLSLAAGWSLIGDVDSQTVKSYWINQQMPFENPGQVVSITPSFGEWHGISASSSWLISDTKPQLKSTSRLDFHFNKENRTRHFYTSFYLNYWSDRDPVSWLGKDNWGRPVWDLGTKLTAEIKSFRIFMKMDNLLNRNNSYVPGYYMPGLIFRWGFAWTITG